MEDFGLGKSTNQNPQKPLSMDDIETKPKGASHSPLDLGGSRPLEVQKTSKPPISKPVAQPQAVSSANMAPQMVPAGRISAVKTFFTKLHPGAMDFLDGQINDWLKENPEVTIKKTNVTVGEIQSKKTEPNIIILIWY